MWDTPEDQIGRVHVFLSGSHGQILVEVLKRINLFGGLRSLFGLIGVGAT